MVTCTDLAVLCGAYPEACAAKYGSFPIKGKYCHESALRVLLACIDTHANRYGRYITPLLSVYINFYVRVFVRVRSTRAQASGDAHPRWIVRRHASAELRATWPCA
eukprot:5800012-Pleurochrysis_carterae.AAC.2